MEIGPTVQHRLGIFGHAAVQRRLGIVIGKVDGIKVTGTQATAAANAVLLIHRHFLRLRVKDQAVIGTLFLAAGAATAFCLADFGLSAGVLLLLPCPGATAHTDVLNRSSKARHLVALEVSQGNKHVRVHYGPADLGFLYIFATYHRHFHVISALQAITNEKRATHGQRSKAIFPCALQMLQSILPAAGVHGIAVGEEGLTAQLLYHIHHRTGVVGAQVADITQLTKVHFNGNKFAFQVQLLNPSFFNQFFQLGGQAVTIGLSMKIGKINL